MCEFTFLIYSLIEVKVDEEPFLLGAMSDVNNFIKKIILSLCCFPLQCFTDTYFCHSLSFWWTIISKRLAHGMLAMVFLIYIFGLDCWLQFKDP